MNKKTLILYLLLTTNLLLGSVLGNKTKESSLIVYNDNIALVHEERALSVNRGDREIIYKGVANTIDTDSVNIDLPDSVTLYSQQYRFDKLSQRKLLDTYIGKKVIVRVQKDTKNFKKIKAKLLSSGGTYSLVETKSSEIISVANKDIIFKAIPTQLITKPSLVWNISAKKDLNSKVKLDYLIKNIKWKSNYILNLKNNRATLDGWITISNRSGKRFKNTKLYVLAGKINRVQQPKIMYKTLRSARVESMAMPSKHSHEGYHFYNIPFRVDIANNETTQIKFINKQELNVKRKYTSVMTNPNYLYGEKKHGISQYIHIKGVDFALPKGIIRTYSKLKDTNILLGETDIGHTPKNTPLDLKLGENFDLKATETILSRDDTKQYRDATVKYTVKNSAKELKNIEILVPFNKNKTSIIETKKSYSFTKGKFISFKLSLKGESSKDFQVHFRDFINF